MDNAQSGGSSVRACTLSELRDRGRLTRQIAGRTLVLVYEDGEVFALDNRCPHMGFPLDRGAVANGVLTCPWHHARFELCTGGTFDPFADDAMTYPTAVRDGAVWVDPGHERDEIAHQKRRLKEGLEQNLPLVLAKACIALASRETNPAELLDVAGGFGATQRAAGWRDGLTVLTAMGKILPQLAAEDKPLALYHGMLYVADNVEGQPPHHPLTPLDIPAARRHKLKSWLRESAHVRDSLGVERVLISALHSHASLQEVADMLIAATTDHYFLDGGHTIDFVNKAFELLDLTSGRHAPEVLVSLIPGIVRGTRMEETNAWRRPVDLKDILEPIFADLLTGNLTSDPRQLGPLNDDSFQALVETLLGDDARVIAQSLADHVTSGISLEALGEALCFASASRVAKFHTANEFDDWISVLHTFSAANATLGLLRRAPSLEAARALWHTAMHLYLNRFLNSPPARLPAQSEMAQLSPDKDHLLAELVSVTDRRQRVYEAAAITQRYLSLGHDPNALIRTLAKVLLREDAEFHSYQMFEASLALYGTIADTRPAHAPIVLVALARYLAGHAPTDRARTQTFDIAQRLARGDAVAPA